MALSSASNVTGTLSNPWLKVQQEHHTALHFSGTSSRSATAPRGPRLCINIGFPRITSCWHTLGAVTSHHEKSPGLGGPRASCFNLPCTILMHKGPHTQPSKVIPGKAVHYESLAFFLFCSSRVQDSCASLLSVVCLGCWGAAVIASLALAGVSCLTGFFSLQEFRDCPWLSSSTGLEGAWIIITWGFHTATWSLTRKKKPKTNSNQVCPLIY